MISTADVAPAIRAASSRYPTTSAYPAASWLTSERPLTRPKPIRPTSSAPRPLRQASAPVRTRVSSSASRSRVAFAVRRSCGSALAPGRDSDGHGADSVISTFQYAPQPSSSCGVPGARSTGTHDRLAPATGTALAGRRKIPVGHGKVHPVAAARARPGKQQAAAGLTRSAVSGERRGVRVRGQFLERQRLGHRFSRSRVWSGAHVDERRPPVGPFGLPVAHPADHLVQCGGRTVGVQSRVGRDRVVYGC